MKNWAVLLVLGGTLASANPYPDPTRVPRDRPHSYPLRVPGKRVDPRVLREGGSEVLRLDLAWLPTSEDFQISGAALEQSGTSALLKRATRRDALGSYQGILYDAASGKPISFASVGTGSEFRKLVRAMSFRFPKPAAPVEFVLEAENPVTGKGEAVLRQWIDPSKLAPVSVPQPKDFEVRLLQSAQTPALAVNIYADGYGSSKKAQFFKEAQRVVDTLKSNAFPMFDRMEFHAVFASSGQMLGSALDQGSTVVERNSFLGLYFPYWNKFGRWYNVVYPTREKKFRDSLGLVPYDYPIALLDNASYWGVGNFNELTAIPAGHSSFTYLLMHEFGHFFGLNEEYEGGGPTELQFAGGIPEPWSQNITFDPTRLKWKALATPGVPLPTPSGYWTGGGPYGAYKGGYADSEPQGKSHKPGLACVMRNGSRFCPICVEALKAKLRYDLGE